MLRPMTRAVLAGGAIALWCAVAAATPQRPAGAPAGDAVAEVHLRIGSGATLRASGKEYAAVPGTALLRSDELIVPAGQVVVVKLRNGYLIRIDDDITLPVGKIVLIDAPRTNESLGSQIERLLTKEEQGRAERIAGTHAQVNGAQSGDIGPAQNKDAGRRAAAGPSGNGPPDPGAGTKTKAESSTPAAAGDRPAAQPSATPPAPIPVESPSKPAMASPSGTDKGDAGPLLQRKQAKTSTLSSRELKRCLASELGKLPVKPKLKTAQLRLYVHGGLIERAQLGGGLVLPECARPLLIGAPSDGAEGRWLQVELPLQ
jgi:hypothetical protein